MTKPVFGSRVYPSPDPEGFDPRKAFGLSDKRVIADMPLSFITDDYDLDKEAALQSIAAAGLSFVLLNAKDQEERHATGRQEWLFVYETKSLQAFLDQNKDVLTEAGWPAKAAEFAFYLSYVTPPANSAIYDLIFDSYGGNSKTGDLCWLRCNDGMVPAQETVRQRTEAELTRQRFKAFRENDPTAAAFILKAAQAGHEDAMVDASRLYQQGRGIEKDPVEAAFWYKLMQKLYAPHGKLSLPFAQNAPHFHLTPEQNDSIRQRISAWTSASAKSAPAKSGLSL